MSTADGEKDEQHLVPDRIGYATTSSQADNPILASTTRTPSGPTTPNAASVPRIAETLPTATTPGSAGSSSGTSSPFLPDNNLSLSRDIRNSPRCSIPGGERGAVFLC